MPGEQTAADYLAFFKFESAPIAPRMKTMGYHHGIMG